jgi:8-oxo-dGTP diphosphatase
MPPQPSGSVSIHLVRHADAGDRDRFAGDDSMRPLSRRGHREATEIGKRLVPVATVLVSSPSFRCLETLAPLSARLHQAIEPLLALGEGEDPTRALEHLVERSTAIGSGLVACSHADVILGIFEVVYDDQVAINGTPNFEKGATTELTVADGRIVKVGFVPPPKR